MASVCMKDDIIRLVCRATCDPDTTCTCGDAISPRCWMRGKRDIISVLGNVGDITNKDRLDLILSLKQELEE